MAPLAFLHSDIRFRLRLELDCSFSVGHESGHCFNSSPTLRADATTGAQRLMLPCLLTRALSPGVPAAAVSICRNPAVGLTFCCVRLEDFK